MNKIRRRTVSVLILVLVIAAGLCVYIVKFAVNGRSWASFSANGNAYYEGRLALGTVTDRNGVVLASIDGGSRVFADERLVRVSTLHAVGDRYGNIGTGALKAFASQLVGYNPVTGLYSLDGNGATVKLTIDSKLNAAAYKAMDGRSGCVAVADYKTGEVLCMVSTPSFDPADPPTIASDDTSGVYINRFLSSSFTPGSVFKLVTLTSAIENIDSLSDWSFDCDGSLDVNGDAVTCTRAHGELKVEDALAVSCNGAFAELSLKLGGDALAKTADKLGMTGRMKISGISTAAGQFAKGADKSSDLAWSGVGQYEDQVNPAEMLRLVMAIANGGRARQMTLKSPRSLDESRLMTAATADKIAEMMSYCVKKTYGEDNFPGLALCAKSGTAEVGGGKDPNAWFVGFLQDTAHPLAFVVMVENGGWGSSAAGSVANAVLQAAVSK